MFAGRQRIAHGFERVLDLLYERSVILATPGGEIGAVAQRADVAGQPAERLLD